MTLAELTARWLERRDAYARLEVSVPAAKLIDELLSEMRQLGTTSDDDLLSLTEAATFSGYSADHLGRLVRMGMLKNFGRHGAPRVRRGDVPRKRSTASDRTPDRACVRIAHPVASPSQIARSLANARKAR